MIPNEVKIIVGSALLLIVLLFVWAMWNYADKVECENFLKLSVATTEKLCKQNDQLKDIIRRCGAELYVDKDGNYDAIIPMTPEEFEEFKRQIRERNK